RLKHFAGGLIALYSIFAQRFADNLLKLGRNLPDVTCKSRRLLLKNRSHHLLWCIASEWRMPCHQFVKDYAKTPDIGTLINLLSARLLGRHLTNRSQYGPEIGLNQQQRFVSWHRCRHFLFRKLCNAKVEHFHVSVRPKNDVLRLDIAMDISRLLRGG